jgi:hypothetical protein
VRGDKNGERTRGSVFALLLVAEAPPFVRIELDNWGGSSGRLADTA